MRYSDLRTFLLIAAFGAASFFPTVSEAGPYTDSAHGNSTYGVSRNDIAAAGFARGNCAHCHEQHASVGGSEPAPVGGEQGYLIFAQNNTDQARNFCLNCHGTGTGYQDGGHVVNRSYSFRAGGWSDSLNNVKDAFSKASSHNLADIVTFAAGMASWKYTANSNACGVCHDPHQVQGDPPNSSNLAKSSPARTGVVTQINSSPVNLWGDALLPDLVTANPVERMSNYPSYIDPYRTVGSAFEPDGNNVQQNGANSVNYVAFCTTCHDATNIINSFDLGQLKFIDWQNFEKHGQVSFDNNVQLKMPYGLPPNPPPVVLSCLDCHEPHGSDNIYLLRGEVNGGETTTPRYLTPITSGFQFGQLCSQCHNPQPVSPGTGVDWEDVHHDPSNPGYLLGLDEPYDYSAAPYQADCTNGASGYCHTQNPPSAQNKIDCMLCHYHGAATGGAIPVPNSGAPSPLSTF